MKESIKKRIEAVRRGEVPEGYVSQNHQLRPVDWKYEKIGKYLVPYDEFSNDTKAYPLATSSRQGLMLQSEYYIDQRYEETTGGFHVVPVGYVTYRHMSDDDIFRFNLNKIGQPVLVSPEYPVFTTTGGLNQDLLVAYLNGMKEFQAFCSAQKKGSTRTRMYFRRLCEFTIPIPSITEQQKIAEILATCDRMIELKQSKIDELKKLKQVCLLEMFPQKGQTIPKRRFPGFSAPWEQRKLAAMCEKFTDGDWIEAKDQSDAGIRLVQTGNIGIAEYFDKPNNKKWISAETFERLHCEEVYPNDILISRLPEPAGRACIMPDLGTKMITAVDCTIVRPAKDVSAKFLLQYLSSQAYFDEVNTCLAGGTRQRISRSNLANFDVPVPIDKAEQNEIGELLSALDHLITLHQRELAEAGKYKKALMQLLLTGLVRVNA